MVLSFKKMAAAISAQVGYSITILDTGSANDLMLDEVSGTACVS